MTKEVRATLTAVQDYDGHVVEVSCDYSQCSYMFEAYVGDLATTWKKMQNHTKEAH